MQRGALPSSTEIPIKLCAWFLAHYSRTRAAISSTFPPPASSRGGSQTRPRRPAPPSEPLTAILKNERRQEASGVVVSRRLKSCRAAREINGNRFQFE